MEREVNIPISMGMCRFVLHNKESEQNSDVRSHLHSMGFNEGTSVKLITA